MGPLDAIKTCLAKSFQFKGRASRAEFWWFAPLYLSCTLIFVFWILPIFQSLNLNGLLIALAITLIPLVAAASRRLQDTGEDGYFAAIPILAPVTIPWVVLFILSPVALGLPVFGTIIVLGLAWLAVFGCLIFSFFWIGPIIGQLIVSSEPGTNRFGPNPNEVPQ